MDVTTPTANPRHPPTPPPPRKQNNNKKQTTTQTATTTDNNNSFRNSFYYFTPVSNSQDGACDVTGTEKHGALMTEKVRVPLSRQFHCHGKWTGCRDRRQSCDGFQDSGTLSACAFGAGTCNVLQLPSHWFRWRVTGTWTVLADAFFMWPDGPKSVADTKLIPANVAMWQMASVRVIMQSTFWEV